MSKHHRSSSSGRRSYGQGHKPHRYVHHQSSHRGKEIQRYDGVEVFTLSDKVLVALTDVVEAEVKRQLIFEELRRVAEVEVVAVVLAVGMIPAALVEPRERYV